MKTLIKKRRKVKNHTLVRSALGRLGYSNFKVFVSFMKSCHTAKNRRVARAWLNDSLPSREAQAMENRYFFGS